MSLRITKSLGYGVFFRTYSEYLDSLTDDFLDLNRKDRYSAGIPFSKYLEWSMKEGSKGKTADTFVMDSMLSEKNEASKYCLADVVDVIEELPYVDAFGTQKHKGLGMLVRPLQVVSSGDWKRCDDVIDYYSSPSAGTESVWRELTVPMYPYDDGDRVNRSTGEPVDITNSEYNYYVNNPDKAPDIPGWRESVPKPPKVLEEIVSALNIFKEPKILVPVVAEWWE